SQLPGGGECRSSVEISSPLSIPGMAGSKRPVVERQKALPRAFGFRLLVDREVENRPAVVAFVNLDFRRNSGSPCRLPQLVLFLRVTGVIVLRDGEEELGSGVVEHVGRSGLLVTHQPAAMKGSNGSDAVGNCRRRPHGKTATHAIALGAD